MFDKVNNNKLLRYFFPILFFIPLSFFTNGIGAGIQWSLFRYQVTYFGNGIFPVATDLYYILSGTISGKSAISGMCLIISTIVLVIAFLLSMANRTRVSGILTILSGAFAISSCFIQYSYLLHSSAGMCIPFGALIYFIYGFLLYRTMPDSNGENLLKKYDYLFLLVGIFLVYSNFSTPMLPNDTIGSQLLPYYLLHDQSIYLDKATYFINNEFYSYRFVDAGNGHFVSLFPIVTPVLITPLYAIPVMLNIPMNDLLMLVMTHISAAFISALASMFVYLICKRMTTRNIALISACIFAFATSTWSISSQTLYAHGMVELLLAIMLYLIIRNEEQQSDRYIIALGFCTGLFIFNRPSDALLVIPIAIYVLWYHRMKMWHYIFSGFLTGLPFLIYNVVLFHNPLGGYLQVSSRLMLDITTLSNYFGLFVSPNKGLFVFSPILILAIIGYYSIKDSKKPFHKVLHLSVIAIAFTILIYASFDDWMGGNLYGPRYLTGLLPYLAIGVCIFLDDYAKKPHSYLINAVIVALILSSVFIQFVGIFYFESYGGPTQNWNNKWSYYDPWDMGNSVIFNSLFHKNAQSITSQVIPFNQTLNYTNMDHLESG
jgi:hypothetical protein